MDSLIYLFVFVFGSIIGSFLNVLILRYNTGRSLGGRSACFSCGAHLSWYELVPILSYVIQRGKCKSCGTAISPQYPIVESITGLVFAAILYKEIAVFNLQPTTYNLQPEFLLSTFYLLLSICLLIAITVYDLRHKIIPNGFVWTFILISFAKVLFLNFPTSSPFHFFTSPDFLAGPILAIPFALIWLLSRGRAMGLGDAKVALGIGWMLGLAGGVSAIFLSFWIGGLLSLFLLLKKKSGFTMKSEIPFGPFLAISAFLTYFFQFDFLGLRNLFF